MTPMPHLLGDKHPRALGRPTREVWPEIWDQFGPMSLAHPARRTRRLLRRRSSLDRQTPWRAGRMRRFTVSYSPVPDPTAPNGIGGLLVTTFETTERVRNEKTLQLLTGQLEDAGARSARRERDRIWTLSEDLLGVSNFRGLLHQRQSGLDARCSAGARTKSRRCMSASCAIPTTRPPANAGRARLAQGVPTVRMENRFRHKDGSWRWLAWTMTADDGPDLCRRPPHHRRERGGRAAARKRAAIPLCWSPASPTTRSIMLDPEGIVASWNAGAERIKGYAADEIVGQHFSRFYTDEDRASGVPARALTIAAAAGKFEAEAWRVRKDGSRFWANVVIDADPRRARQAGRLCQDHPRHHRAARSAGSARARAAAARAGAEDGGARPAHRRRRARLQQSADGRHRPCAGLDAAG